ANRYCATVSSICCRKLCVPDGANRPSTRCSSGGSTLRPASGGSASRASSSLTSTTARCSRPPTVILNPCSSLRGFVSRAPMFLRRLPKAGRGVSYFSRLDHHPTCCLPCLISRDRQKEQHV